MGNAENKGQEPGTEEVGKMIGERFLDLCREGVSDDDQATVRKMLEEQPELARYRDTRGALEGETPLHTASLKAREKVVRVLLEYGADVNAHSKHNGTPLHSTCSRNDDTVARLLLERGAEVNAQRKDGGTPLHRASAGGHEKLVRLLLEHGADRDIQDHSGKTPRDSAEGCGRTEVMELLDSYFPITAQMVQVLLGLGGPTESPLTRFAEHSAFEPKVLSLVKCLLTGEQSAVFDQLQRDLHNGTGS